MERFLYEAAGAAVVGAMPVRAVFPIGRAQRGFIASVYAAAVGVHHFANGFAVEQGLELGF
ncbi:hypothetical protein D3C71_2218180 [compost metagenome]